MSKCCSCIGGYTTDTYQPLSSHISRGSVKLPKDSRDAFRSPRNQQRKLSVRYDVVRSVGSARLDESLNGNDNRKKWEILDARKVKLKYSEDFLYVFSNVDSGRYREFDDHINFSVYSNLTL